MAQTNAIFEKTAVTTIDDTHNVIIGKSTGDPDITTWANIKSKIETYIGTLFCALTGNQTIAGTKTFTSNIVGNITGNITGNAESVTNGIYKDGSVAFTGKQTFDVLGVNIPDFTGTLPVNSADSMGVVGDIIYFREDTYRKTSSVGWIKNGATF